MKTYKGSICRSLEKERREIFIEMVTFWFLIDGMMVLSGKLEEEYLRQHEKHMQI